jgi:hypothetical protein
MEGGHMSEQPERQIVRVGDVVARKYEWSDEYLHATVEEAYLADWQKVVDAGLWRIVTKGGINERNV